jgi:tRNA-specific 2-thiouridylase
VDQAKDQSDFLWPLTQTQLAAARFPVGHLTKAEVRDRARQLGLITAEKPESQEICFVPDDDYRGFLKRRDPAMFAPGAIVHAATGEMIGRHRGLANYTIGQRKGLGLVTSRSLYVLDLDLTRNAVVVGEAAALEQDRLTAAQANFIACEPPAAPMRVQAKIRHSQTAAPASVRALAPATVEVVCDAPQRAITPGQSVVFYNGDCVVGGAVIERGSSR